MAPPNIIEPASSAGSVTHDGTREVYAGCRPARLRARTAHGLSRAGGSAGQNRCVCRVGTKNARHDASAQRWTVPWAVIWKRCQ